MIEVEYGKKNESKTSWEGPLNRLAGKSRFRKARAGTPDLKNRFTGGKRGRRLSTLCQRKGAAWNAEVRRINGKT